MYSLRCKLLHLDQKNVIWLRGTARGAVASQLFDVTVQHDQC